MQLSTSQARRYAQRLLSCELSPQSPDFINQIISGSRQLSPKQIKFLLDLVHTHLPVLDRADEVVRIDRRLEQCQAEMQALGARRSELCELVGSDVLVLGE